MATTERIRSLIDLSFLPQLQAWDQNVFNDVALKGLMPYTTVPSNPHVVSFVVCQPMHCLVPCACLAMSRSLAGWLAAVPGAQSVLGGAIIVHMKPPTPY